jgi:hypothetical protein
MSTLLPCPDLQCLAVPYEVQQSRNGAFLVSTGSGAIQQLLDTTLNAALTPPGAPLVKRFEPLFGLDQIIVAFIHYPNVHAQQSAVPQTDRWGFFSYDECAVFLMLKDTHASGPGFCWHLPFILLNKCLPMLLGREVYGMPKVMGTLNVDPLLQSNWLNAQSGLLTAATEGFLKRDETASSQQVKVAQAAIAMSVPLMPFLGPQLLGPGVFQFLQTFVTTGMPGIFLKQFAEGDGATQASYQAVLQSQFTPTAVSSPTLISGAIQVFDPASYPLASTFGIPAGVPIPVVGILIEISWILPVATPI